MKTELFLMAGGIAAFLMLRQPDASAPVAVKAEPSAPVAKKMSWSPVSIKPADLVVVGGAVRTFTGDGLIVDCAPPIGSHVRPWDGPGWKLPANASAGEIENLAKAASIAEKQRYGEVMELKSGVLTEARVTPKDSTTGRVLLVGYPSPEKIADGVEMRVVAAPMPGEIYEYKDNQGRQRRLQVYTMNYELLEKDNRRPDWMNR